jgi:hypothetical protein
VSAYLYDPEVDTLTGILAKCGYTHRKAPNRMGDVQGMRDVVDADGAVVFTGSYVNTLAWLAENGLACEKAARS